MHIFIKKIEPLTANQSILCAFIKNIKQNILFLTLWSLELIRETMIAPRSAYRRALLFVQILCRRILPVFLYLPIQNSHYVLLI